MSGKLAPLSSVAPTLAPRTRRYQPVETRQRILEAAARLFRENGYASTSTADLAIAADVAEGSIFYHFGSKRALLEALGQDYAQRMIAAMRGDDADSDPGPLDPGMMVSRCFDFCKIAGNPKEMIGIDPHSGDGEEFESGSRKVVINYVEQALTAACEREGVSTINIPMTAAMAYAAVHEALMRAHKTQDITAQDYEAIRQEAMRFTRAACIIRSANG
jgi:AcrR family transcriptional regulator